MSIEAELKEIKESIIQISKKLDELVYEKEITSMMKLSEKSLEFLKEEPDIYSVKDLKVRYK
ncbi:MAG: hypothetical protein DRN95_01480 [Candidatus Hydrothermarchaeota archaeon]|nr:MAG: hypothetical protein DRN95_01480 [Candidatus Hydrothermarchaeota archaeon]